MATPSAPLVPDAARLSGGPLTVTGNVIFPDDLPPGPVASISITIQDVSRADAPAVDLVSVTIPAGETAPVAGQAIPFSIPVATDDARITYSVRARVDRDGDGQVRSGDLVSTTHNPVLTHGAGMAVDVPLSVVG